MSTSTPGVRVAGTSTVPAAGPAAPPTPDDVGGVGARAAMQFALTAASAISVAVVTVALLVQAAAPQLWTTAPWLVFAVGLVLGVPHGALDHLVPWWTSTRTRSLPRLAGLMSGYLALAVLAFLAARAFPTTALAGFLLISALHFGVGEVAIDALRRRGRPGPGIDVAMILAFGTTTVAGPMVAWPDVANPVLQALAPAAGPLLASGWQPAGLVAIAGFDLVVVMALLAARRVAAAGELLLLGALFWLVPPLPAFAVYFGAWHGLRHLARLTATDPANVADLARRHPARPLRRLALHAAPPTLAVTGVLLTVWLVPGLADHVAHGAVSAGLAVIFALTVPHLLVVAVLDRRQLRTALVHPGTPRG